jgi:hypothetical protein
MLLYVLSLYDMHKKLVTANSFYALWPLLLHCIMLAPYSQTICVLNLHNFSNFLKLNNASATGFKKQYLSIHYRCKSSHYNSVLLKKLVVTQLVKKFSAFMEHKGALCPQNHTTGPCYGPAERKPILTPHFILHEVYTYTFYTGYKSMTW